MIHRYLHYDVFTTTPLAGNALAVLLDARGLDDAAMQRIAREMNFSETTFILPAGRADTDVRMRIFTPAVEMPMAGHPTVGSTFALAESGTIAVGRERFVFELNVGPTPVDLEWDGSALRFVWMTQAVPSFGVAVEARLVAEALGLEQDTVLATTPVQEVSCGVPYLIVPLRDAAAVDRAAADAGSFARLRDATGRELPVYLFALTADEASKAGGLSERGGGRASDANPVFASAVSCYCRMFAPGLGVAEDPATGSAAGPLGCYLVRYGLAPTVTNLAHPRGVAGAEQAPVEGAAALVITQGVKMERPSRMHVVVRSSPEGITQVKVGGQAVLVGRGELSL